MRYNRRYLTPGAVVPQFDFGTKSEGRDKLPAPRPMPCQTLLSKVRPLPPRLQAVEPHPLPSRAPEPAPKPWLALSGSGAGASSPSPHIYGRERYGLRCRVVERVLLRQRLMRKAEVGSEVMQRNGRRVIRQLPAKGRRQAAEPPATQP